MLVGKINGGWDQTWSIHLCSDQDRCRRQASHENFCQGLKQQSPEPSLKRQPQLEEGGSAQASNRQARLPQPREPPHWQRWNSSTTGRGGLMLRVVGAGISGQVGC